jgi:hypothetical protein
LEIRTDIADEDRCVVEFEVDHPVRGIVAIVDVFTIDADASPAWRCTGLTRRSVRRQHTSKPAGRSFTELVAAGCITRTKQGRRNNYNDQHSGPATRPGCPRTKRWRALTLLTHKPL